MDRRGLAGLVVVLGFVAVGLFVVAASPPGGGVDPVDASATDCANATTDAVVADRGAYNWTTVDVRTGNGTALATVEVRIADTREKRYTGLSDTASLPPGEGMLFVHDDEGRYTYVMRRMDFPLDIVFVSAEGEITGVQHAPVPEEVPGGNGEFPGRGKYVLEVDRGWANATGAGPGDCVVVPAELRD